MALYYPDHNAINGESGGPSIDTLDQSKVSVPLFKKVVISCSFPRAVPFLILSNFNFLEDVHLSSFTEQLVCP